MLTSGGHLLRVSHSLSVVGNETLTILVHGRYSVCLRASDDYDRWQ
jgi:hypothetical protein